METAYFETLFSGYDEEEERTIELRALRPQWAECPTPSRSVGRHWFPLTATGRQEALQTALKWAERTLEVYCGILPRIARSGTQEGITLTKTLWTDIDAGQGTPEDALSLLKQAIQRQRVPIPCMVVCSGGGLHVYWTLPEVVPLPSQEARTHFKGLLKRIGEGIGGSDPAPHADLSCADVARILRVPGTKNFKQRGNPRPVEVLHCDPQAPLSLTEWEALHPLPRIAPRRIDPIHPQDTESYAGLWRWAKEPYAEGTRHKGFTSAARWLLREVCVPESVAFELLMQKGHVSSGTHPVSEEEIRRIVQWAK